MSQAQLLPSDHFSPSVTLHKGRPSTTSLEVSKFFGKRHDDVLKSIRNLCANCPEEFAARNFAETPYTEEQNGQTYTLFILHRDGFMLLVMGYTGKKAMQIKIAYIQAFNAMEEQLLGRALPSPLTPSTPDSRRPLEKLVKVWASQAHMPHAQAWTQVNAHFQLERIADLPTEWIPDAIAFVEGKIDGLQKALIAGDTEQQEHRKRRYREDLELAIKMVKIIGIQVAAQSDVVQRVLNDRLANMP